MRKTTRLFALAAAGIMALSMTACGGNSTTASSEEATASSEEATTSAQESTGAAGSDAADKGTEKAAADGKTFKIGVLQLTQHAALDAANEGFFDALDEAGIQYEADQQNASGDQPTCQTIAQKLVDDKDDLILAIATPAAQAVKGTTSDIPVLVTCVTDPAESGLVNDNKEPGINVSGTSDLTPVKKQIDLLQQILPDAKTVGILYSSSEANSVLQAKMARDAIEAAGMEAVDYTVSNSNEIQTVVDSMVGKVDAIYAPTDNMIASGMPTVSMVANEKKLPVICGEEGMVKAGGLATYGINYYKLGYLTGQQAVKILRDGADISKMPIEYLPDEECALTVNEETAAKLEIDVSGLK